LLTKKGKYGFIYDDEHPVELSTSSQSIPQYAEVPPNIEGK